jgi:putative transposase
LRLAGYDYTTLGAYFVTIGTQHRRCILSRIEMHRVCLTPLGEIVESELRRTGEARASVRVDSFVIMPNHVHAIVILGDGGRRPPRLGVVINGFKSSVTRRVRASSGRDLAIWQRGYFDRIVRNERELDAIRDYIATNPARWAEDRYDAHQP